MKSSRWARQCAMTWLRRELRAVQSPDGFDRPGPGSGPARRSPPLRRPGSPYSTSSTSFGATFSPRLLMISSLPRDKVEVARLVHAEKVSRVAHRSPGSGPEPETLGGRFRRLPVAPHHMAAAHAPAPRPGPGPRRRPASSSSQASVPGIAMPTEPGRRSSSSGGRYSVRLVSVRPYIEKTATSGKPSA